MKKYGSFLKFFWGVCVFILTVSGTLYAQNTIKLAAYTFPPFNFGDSPNTVSGADAEITIAVLNKMGVEVKFAVRPFNRALREMKDGKIAGILPCVNSAARREFIYFSTIPTAALDRRFYKIKSSNIEWNKYEDLKGLVVGASDYSYPQEFWDAENKGIYSIHVIKSNTPDLINFRKLVHKRIDLLIVDISVGGNIIASNSPQFDNVVVVPHKSIGKIVPFSFGLSKKYWAGKKNEAMRFLKLYEKSLLEFIKDGSRNRIFEKYNMKPNLDAQKRLIIN